MSVKTTWNTLETSCENSAHSRPSRLTHTFALIPKIVQPILGGPEAFPGQLGSHQLIMHGKHPVGGAMEPSQLDAPTTSFTSLSNVMVK